MNTISLNIISQLHIQTRNPYKSILCNFKKFGIEHYLQRTTMREMIFSIHTVLQNFKIKL